jgi:hypothetical protein
MYGSADSPARRGLTIQVKTGAEQTGDEGVEILDYASWQPILPQFVEIQPVEGIRQARKESEVLAVLRDSAYLRNRAVRPARRWSPYL